MTSNSMFPWKFCSCLHSNSTFRHTQMGQIFLQWLDLIRQNKAAWYSHPISMHATGRCIPKNSRGPGLVCWSWAHIPATFLCLWMFNKTLWNRLMFEKNHEFKGTFMYFSPWLIASVVTKWHQNKTASNSFQIPLSESMGDYGDMHIPIQSNISNIITNRMIMDILDNMVLIIFPIP